MKGYWTPEIPLAGSGPRAQRVELRAQWGELRATENCSQGLKPKGVCPDGFQNFFGIETPFYFPFLPFWAILPVTIIFLMSHHFLFEAD